MKKIIIVVIGLMLLCGVACAEKYNLSQDEQKFLLAVLANADIKGANAPMLLQVAQALQKPIADEVKVEEPK